MKQIFLLLFIISLSFATEYKIVFKLTASDENKILKQLINNLITLEIYYNSRGDSIKSAVVISGKSYKFFSKKFKTGIDIKLQELSQHGTEFKMCAAGMRRLGIKDASIDNYVTPEFNSASAISEYRDAGYLYMEVK